MQVERALMSVYDKTGLDVFARGLSDLGVEIVASGGTAAYIADLGIDSLGMLELVGSMERDLKVTVPDEQLVGLQTVRQLLDVVHKRVAQ